MLTDIVKINSRVMRDVHSNDRLYIYVTGIRGDGSKKEIGLVVLNKNMVKPPLDTIYKNIYDGVSELRVPIVTDGLKEMADTVATREQSFVYKYWNK